MIPNSIKGLTTEHLFDLWQKHGLNAANILALPSEVNLFDVISCKKLRNANVVVGNINDADAGTFDAIVASLYQLRDTPEQFLHQALKTLVAGGLLVISTFGIKTTDSTVECLHSMEDIKAAVPEGFEMLELHAGLITTKPAECATLDNEAPCVTCQPVYLVLRKSA